MRVLVIAAMGSVALAGCAPFQHGHYSDDVAYLNSKGDPPGTPLVYQEGLRDNAQLAQANFTAPSSVPLWPQTTGTANNAFGAGGFPTLNVAQQSAQFSQPVSFSAPAPIQQASVSFPTIPAPISYTPAVQQTIVAPVQSFAPPTVQRFVPPIRQTVVRQVVRQPVISQAPAPQPIRQRVQRASFVEPTRSPQNNVLATSYSGHQVDADGFAICNIPWPGHAANKTPEFRPAYQPASYVQRSRPKGPLRF